MCEFDSLLETFIPSRDVGTDVILSREMTDVSNCVKCLLTILEEILKAFFFNSSLDSEVNLSLVIKLGVLFFCMMYASALCVSISNIFLYRS